MIDVRFSKEFAFSPIDVAHKFVEDFSAADVDWRSSIREPSVDAVNFLKLGLREARPTMSILWDLRKKLNKALVSVFCAEVLTNGEVEWAETWKQEPERFRSFLRIAARMDKGDWEACDVDWASGSDVVDSRQTLAIRQFLSRLEEKIGNANGER